MKSVTAVAAAVLMLGFAHEAVGEKPETGPLALEKKLHGAWQGQSGCQGDLTLRADGTYEKSKCGPGGDSFAGTWEVQWDALPLKLVMICKTADDPKAVGKKDVVNLTKLDDKSLSVTYPGSDFTWQYARMKKPTDEKPKRKGEDK